MKNIVQKNPSKLTTGKTRYFYETVCMGNHSNYEDIIHPSETSIRHKTLMQCGMKVSIGCLVVIGSNIFLRYNFRINLTIGNHIESHGQKVIL